MEAVAAGEISFPAILDCTRYDTCSACNASVSRQSPALPGTAQQPQKIGALVQLQPCQRNLNDHCHEELRNNAVIPVPLPIKCSTWQSVNTQLPAGIARPLLWGSEEALAGTQPCFALILQTLGLMEGLRENGAVDWRETRSWLLSGVY